IVQAHDLVLAPSVDGWYLAGIDRSPQAMLRRLVPRRGRPDLRRHVILDWKDVQPFVGHVPTAKLLMPLQRLRRLHPAQIADIVEDASHAEGQEIIEAVESDPAFTADVFEELDAEHQVEFLKSKSNQEAARQRLTAVFITEQDGQYAGSIGVVELLRADRARKVHELELTMVSLHGNADFADVALMMADYNLTSLAVVDAAGNLIGAISADDVIEALVPEDWRNRAEASTGV